MNGLIAIKVVKQLVVEGDGVDTQPLGYQDTDLASQIQVSQSIGKKIIQKIQFVSTVYE